MSSADQVFSHAAMNCTFRLCLRGLPPRRAASLAREGIELIDSLEDKLSRYREGSDVWQINRMEAGEELFLSETTYACLRLAMGVTLSTGGRFDVTLGHAIDHLKTGQPGPPPPATGQLVLHPDRPVIHCQSPGRALDLGGIGKGFALDQLKALLTGWEVPAALLSAGNSTHLAFGADAWPVALTGDKAHHSLLLREQALSASGFGIQGVHLLSPDGHLPDPSLKRAWVLHASAALADAWSTAVLLMDAPARQAARAAVAGLFVETATGIAAIEG